MKFIALQQRNVYSTGHYCWHIVPRWIGDTNFMPTIAGVHTIPQSLEALWELLIAELKR